MLRSRRSLQQRRHRVARDGGVTGDPPVLVAARADTPVRIFANHRDRLLFNYPTGVLDSTSEQEEMMDMDCPAAISNDAG